MKKKSKALAGAVEFFEQFLYVVGKETGMGMGKISAKKSVMVLLAVFILSAGNAFGFTKGDINGDNQVGLSEAVYALQVAAGLTPEPLVSVWKGDWATGTEYTLYDAVGHNGSSYICIENHTSSDTERPDISQKWNLMSQKGDTGAAGPQGLKGDKGDTGDPAKYTDLGSGLYQLDFADGSSVKGVIADGPSICAILGGSWNGTSCQIGSEITTTTTTTMGASTTTTTTAVTTTTIISALIYNGVASDADSASSLEAIAKKAGYQTEFFTDPKLITEKLKTANLLIFGGSEDDLNPLMNLFNAETVQAVKDFINNGGVYLGVCGGAFIASDGWEDPDGFVKALGFTQIETDSYLIDPAPVVIKVKWKKGEVVSERAVYYQFGPKFLPASENPVQVIANYDDNTIAACLVNSGKGKLILVGPHPEADETWIDDTVKNFGDWTPTLDLSDELMSLAIGK